MATRHKKAATTSKGNNAKACHSIGLTKGEIRLLMIAAGDRISRLVEVRMSGAITGKELDEHIDRWRTIIKKLEECLTDHL